MNFCLPILTLLLGNTGFQNAPIDLQLAKRCFQEARWASDDDGGKLWGKTLYGPMLFLDPKTRFAVANQPDQDGKLEARDGVWVGTMPPTVGSANTAIDWSGVHWTMVLWPMPSETAQRSMLMLHECFHRVQADAGFPSPRPEPANVHLDAKDGRIWLRMEYRALSRALPAWGSERRQSIADALTFRAYRRSLFKGAASEEDRMEMHEGMAEYTGVSCMGLDNSGARYYMAGRLKVFEHITSFPFSFAYQTGPSYGLMLDMESDHWRKEATPQSSLSDLLRDFNKITLPKDLKRAALERAKSYSGEEVFQEEEKREQDRLAKESFYRRSLLTGPVLILPMGNHQNYSFNPNEVFPLGKDGTVYPTCQVSDDWGILVASKGVRFAPDYSQAFVSSPSSAQTLTGDGWTLTLNKGWGLVPGPRKGDYILKKS